MTPPQLFFSAPKLVDSGLMDKWTAGQNTSLKKKTNANFSISSQSSSRRLLDQIVSNIVQAPKVWSPLTVGVLAEKTQVATAGKPTGESSAFS